MRILTPILVSPPFELQFGSLSSGYYMPFARYDDPNRLQSFGDNAMRALIDPNEIEAIRNNQDERIIDPNGMGGFNYRG